MSRYPQPHSREKLFFWAHTNPFDNEVVGREYLYEEPGQWRPSSIHLQMLVILKFNNVFLLASALSPYFPLHSLKQRPSPLVC